MDENVVQAMRRWRLIARQQPGKDPWMIFVPMRIDDGRRIFG